MKFFLFLIFFLVSLTTQAQNDLQNLIESTNKLTLDQPQKEDLQKTVSINRQYAQQRLVISNVFLQNNTMLDIGKQVKDGIYNNLKQMDNIMLFSTEDFLDNIYIPYEINDFLSFKDKTDFIIVPALSQDAKGYVLNIRIYDVFYEQEILNKAYNFQPKNINQLINFISNVSYETITGEVGLFGGNLLYVSSGLTQLKNPQKKISLFSFDNKKADYLVNDANIVLNPFYYNNVVLFAAFENNYPGLFFLNTKTRKKYRVNITNIDTRDKILFSPSISPDKTSIIFSLSFSGKTDIYKLDLKTSLAKQLTFGDSINTSPSFSPLGDKIIFTSDKSGISRIMMMDTEGDNLQQISFERGMYLSPRFSPDGNQIVFSKIYKGLFHIGVIDLLSGKETIVHTAYIAEDPKWINNQNIIFSGKEYESDKFYQPYIFSLKTKRLRKIDIYDNVSQVSYLANL